MLYKNLRIPLSFFVLLSSCALNNISVSYTKYQQAILSYESRDYHKASLLFEQILPQLRGTKEAASVYFFQAYCDFYQKKYVQSSERFQYFCETFLGDPRVEEAMYMQGHTLYLISPDVKCDATLTKEAIAVLCSYIDRYPQGVYVERANVQLRALYDKLAIQAFHNAKLYYQLAHYRAAVVALGNFCKDFPNALSNEEAAYLRADAQCRYAQKAKGTDRDKQSGIAIAYCKEFLDSYPNSSYALVVESLCKSAISARKSKASLKHK